MPPAMDELPELIMVCRIAPPFKATKKARITLQKILQSAVDYLDFRCAFLALISNQRPSLFLQAVRDQRERAGLTAGQPTTNPLPFVIDADYSGDCLSRLQPAARATLSVVLRAGDPLGSMEVGVVGPTAEMADNFLNKALSIGRHVADTIQDSFFIKQKDRGLRRLSLWLETVSAISSTLNINQVMHVVTQLAADLFSARCCIFLFNDQDGSLVPAVAVGSYDPVVKKKWKALKGCSPFPAILDLIKTRETVVLTPENIQNGMPQGMIDDFSYARVVIAPITFKDKVFGVMQVDRPIQGKEFSQEEIAIISAIAKETAVAMENAKLIETLAQKEQLLHQLYNNLICAQEDERKRVASEIHDGVIQALLGIWYRMEHLTGCGSPHKINFQEEMSRLKDLLGEQIQNIRQIVYNLRPVMLDTYGLGPAVRSLLRNLQEESGITFELAMESANYRLPTNFEVALYRILQELLANVVKHSQATKSQVMLIVGQDQTVLVVRDNGTGFDRLQIKRWPPPGNHLGLASIQERVLLLGGTCAINSQLGWGTTITIQVPTPQPSEGGTAHAKNKLAHC